MLTKAAFLSYFFYAISLLKFKEKNTMKIGSKLLGLLFTAVFFMAGCVQQPSTGNTGTTNAPASGKIKIGFAMATVKEERWQRDRDAFQAHCQKMNVECVLTFADNKPEKQLSDVE